LKFGYFVEFENLIFGHLNEHENLDLKYSVEH
jgi:hypothetical protein